MSRPRVDVVVLTRNDRPAEEAAAQATLLAQSGVDVRVVVVGNGCKPEVVPPGALTVCLPGNIGIPGGRNAGADALRDAGDPAAWLYFLDNDATFPRPDVLARLVAEAERHSEAAWVQPRLTGPDDVTTQRRWVPRLRASNPGRPGKVASMTEGVVLIRRDAFDAVGGGKVNSSCITRGSTWPGGCTRRAGAAGTRRRSACTTHSPNPPATRCTTGSPPATGSGSPTATSPPPSSPST